MNGFMVCQELAYGYCAALLKLHMPSDCDDGQNITYALDVIGALETIHNVVASLSTSSLAEDVVE